MISFRFILFGTFFVLSTDFFVLLTFEWIYFLFVCLFPWMFFVLSVANAAADAADVGFIRLHFSRTFRFSFCFDFLEF